MSISDKKKKILLLVNPEDYKGENLLPLLEEVTAEGMPIAVFIRRVALKYAESYPDIKRLIASLK